MRSLSAKVHIALGQVGLLTALLLLSIWIGLVPDRIGAVREGRIAMAEAIAANGSALVGSGDLRKLESTLKLVVDRNEGLLSAGVRRSDRRLLARIGDHDQLWDAASGRSSTDTQLVVPLWSGRQTWGQVELRFEPLSAPGLLGYLQHPNFRLVAFLGIAAFCLFYFYLGRLLKHLDPSQAVPTHVRSALDTLAEGLLVIDMKERVVLANQAFSTMLGRKDDELMGKRASEFAWKNTEGEPVEVADLPWARALADGSSQRNDLLGLEDAESNSRTFLVNCSPVLGSGGRAGGVLVSLDDVTQLEENKEQLAAAMSEAEAANKAKSDFLANMSHEIRTPMNAILGFTEVLKRGFAKSEEDRTKHLNTIHSSGTHLLHLINDVLDLSKVESGRLEIEQMRFPAHTLIQEVVNVLRVKADEKSIGLDFEVSGELPETVLSDPTRFRQIMTNLVSNAIKFTDREGVRVVARLSPPGPERQLCIDVIDAGIGIAEDKFEAIFEAFVQADASVTRRFGGTGLGLPISRRFARLMGGDITVASEPGRGSTFTVVLDPGPLEGIRLLSPEESLTATRQSTGSGDGQWRFASGRVLVVDDGDENRELATLVLEEAGLTVLGAQNGQVAVDMVRNNRFDVILMDIQMPVLDGYAATAQLRKEGVETPIIALTADAMKGAEERCREAGCSDFLTKPIDIDALLEKMAELLGGQQESAPSPAAATAPAVQPTAVTAATPFAAAHSTGPPVLSKLAANPRFRPTVEKFVPRLEEKLGAMQAAWQERDYEVLARLAHWLKGAAGTVGFDAFTEPALELEQQIKKRSEAEIEASLGTLRGLAGRIQISGDASAGSSPAASPPQAPAEVSTPAAASDEPLRSRLESVNPRFIPTIRKFVPRLLEKLEAMDVSCQAGDFEELVRLGHWLKGAGGTVGFDVFTEPAAHLELLAKEHKASEVEAAIQELRSMADRIVVGGDG